MIAKIRYKRPVDSHKNPSLDSFKASEKKSWPDVQIPPELTSKNLNLYINPMEKVSYFQSVQSLVIRNQLRTIVHDVAKT